MEESDIAYLSLADQVFTLVENAILSGAIKPGERIVELEIAKKIGVSKSPVREALKKLESDGIVQLSPRRGYHVRRIDRKSVEDLFDVMAVFQPAVAELAIGGKTEASVRELEGLLKGMKEAIVCGDEAAYLRCNDQFHNIFYGLTRNEWVVKTALMFHKQECLLRSLSLNIRERTATAMDEHHAIFNAFKAGNPDLLAGAIRYHLAQCRTCILQALVLQEGAGIKG